MDNKQIVERELMFLANLKVSTRLAAGFGIVILLLWLFITSYAILLGAEINAESEQQTVKDTTKGAEQPVGQRDAVKADTIPEPDDGSASKNKR